jgi:Tfp pilus assembly protein PilX
MRPEQHSKGMAVRRLQDERGIALIFAIAAMTVLLVAATAAVNYATANQQSAHRSRASQIAYSLAEAGLNNAMSRLYAALDPLNPAAVPSTTSTLEGGTATYSGTLNSDTWTLTSSGSTQNPATAGMITRTVSQQVRVTVTASLLWTYMYSDATTGCMTVKQNAIISAPMYVRGNLCLENNAHIQNPENGPITLQVGGTLDLKNGASVGYNTTSGKLSAVKASRCSLNLGSTHTCTAADRVYATSLSSTPDAMTKPPVDLPFWRQYANLGPNAPCRAGDSVLTFTGSSLFDLSPATSDYTCRSADGRGELSWNRSTNTLTIKGTIYLDRPLTSSGITTYSGRATIYTGGTFLLTNNATLCGVAACDATWNPNTNLLVVVAGATTNLYSPSFGALLDNNARYQGGLYVVKDYRISNDAVNWGPVIANQIDIANNAGIKPFTSLPDGAPGVSKTLSIVPGTYSG